MCVCLCVCLCLRVCMHLSVAAILACLFDQPIKALRRGQIAWTNTLSLLQSLWISPSPSHTLTIMNTLRHTWTHFPPCVAASLPSPSGYEEYCAASSALSIRSGEYISVSLSVFLLYLKLHIELKVNV